VATDEQCCPRYPDCTARFYEPHWCKVECWYDDAQSKLDACVTLPELRRAWLPLARAGKVDLIYGAEWHHAVAHLRYQQAKEGQA